MTYLAMLWYVFSLFMFSGSMCNPSVADCQRLSVRRDAAQEDIWTWKGVIIVAGLVRATSKAFGGLLVLDARRA